MIIELKIHKIKNRDLNKIVTATSLSNPDIPNYNTNDKILYLEGQYNWKQFFRMF